MFDDIYDNGRIILGKVVWVKEYLAKNCEKVEEIKDIMIELEDLDAGDIVAVNYDHPMGYTIEYWKYGNKVTNF